jgi:hypothetical protein
MIELIATESSWWCATNYYVLVACDLDSES